MILVRDEPANFTIVKLYFPNRRSPLAQSPGSSRTISRARWRHVAASPTNRPVKVNSVPKERAILEVRGCARSKGRLREGEAPFRLQRENVYDYIKRRECAEIRMLMRADKVRRRINIADREMTCARMFNGQSICAATSFIINIDAIVNVRGYIRDRSKNSARSQSTRRRY